MRRLPGVLTLLALLVAAAPASAAPPPNDNFATPTVLAGGASETPATTVDATMEPGETRQHVDFDNSHSVWFSWTPSASGDAAIDACDGGFNEVMAVYTGDSLQSLTRVISADDRRGCGSNGARVSFPVTAGTTYRIVVAHAEFSGAASSFHLRVNYAAENNFFADRVVIGAGTETVLGDTVGATREVSEPLGAERTAWYSWTAPASGQAIFSTCDADFQTDLDVFTGGTLATLTQVVSGSSAPCGASGTRSALTVTSGTTYHVRVGGPTTGDFGTFTLRLPPPNDHFTSAEVFINQVTATDSVSSLNATRQTSEPVHDGAFFESSTWWRFTPASGDRRKAVETCGSVPGAVVAAYTGATLASLSPVPEVAPLRPSVVCPDGTVASLVRWQALNGVDYSVALDGPPADVARLTLWGQNANGDAFSAASDYGDGAGTRRWNNTLAATKEAGEPAHAGNAGGGSYWASWRASESRPTTISTCGSRLADTLLGVYTGGAVNALTEIASSDDTELCGNGTQSAVTFDAVAGTTYRIAVDGKDGTAGFIRVNPDSPANDRFADAAPLSGALPAVADGTLDSATPEQGEPQHAGGESESTAWWAWTAPGNGTVTADTCGSSEVSDTLLGVYTGGAVNALTEVASNDDAAPGGCAPDRPRASRTTFDAVAGTTYRIAVAGSSGSEDDVRLALSGALTAPAAGAPGPTANPLRPRLLSGLRFPARPRVRTFRASKGLRASVRCSRPCTLTAQLRVTKPVARRLRLKRRSRVVAVASRRLTSAGRATLVLRPVKRARPRLRRLRGQRVTLLVRGRDTASGERERLTRTRRMRR